MDKHNTQKFKLTDHIHYDRNEPGQPQSVYFDVDPIFGERLNDVLAEVENSLNRDKITDIEIALGRTSAAIEKNFGELTIGQLLYVAHTVSSMLTANVAEHFGYQKGYAHAMERLNSPSVGVTDIFGRHQKGGIS